MITEGHGRYYKTDFKFSGGQQSELQFSLRTGSRLRGAQQIILSVSAKRRQRGAKPHRPSNSGTGSLFAG